MKVKKETGDWREAYKAIGEKFDLPYGGAYLTADKDGELKKAKFDGWLAGVCAEFNGKYVLEGVEFNGEGSGSFTIINGDLASYGVKLNGKASGIHMTINGAYAGLVMELNESEAGTSINLNGPHAGRNIRVNASYAGKFINVNGIRYKNAEDFLRKTSYGAVSNSDSAQPSNLFEYLKSLFFS